jgi:uncharacterized protein YbjT (DUF2867 family)
MDIEENVVIRHPAIEMVIGDLQDALSLNQAVKGVDAVLTRKGN